MAPNVGPCDLCAQSVPAALALHGSQFLTECPSLMLCVPQ
jgi:hypothetical protein